MSGRVIGGGGGGSGGGGLSIASMGRNRPSANGAASSGSRPNSRPNSRPGSRPASRRGSNAFLNEDHHSGIDDDDWSIFAAGILDFVTFFSVWFRCPLTLPAPYLL